MNKTILASITFFSLTGCTNVNTVDNILSETKTSYRPPLVCPEQTIKVCQGADKKQITKYERHFCKCLSRKAVRDSLRNMYL